MATNSIKLLTGNSYPQLARLVADRYVHAIFEHFRALLLARIQAWSFHFSVETVHHGITVPLLRQSKVAEHSERALGLHKKSGPLISRLTLSTGWE
jgi:hypothetical protein